MSEIPEELKYTKDHEWAADADGVITVGITAYAVHQLGDVTLVDLATVGTTVKENERFGDIESVKTVSELFAPIAGEIVEVNDDLEGSPELVNDSPYENGWMVRIRPEAPADVGSLLDASAYESFLSELDD
jgi:glycine cleavage system H protein